MSRGEGTPALAISGVEVQYSSFLSARAVVRWLRSDRVYARALRRREACFPRRALVVQRASCKLQRQASAARRAAKTRRRSLSLELRCSIRAFCARAPCCAGRDRSVSTQEHCAGERPVSLGARSWCDVSVASSNAKQAPRVTRRRRACAPAPAVSWEEAQHSSPLLRARRAAPVAVCPCPPQRALRR